MEASGEVGAVPRVEPARLLHLVTEARGHGVPAALATSALTGAFAAATSNARELRLDALLASLRANDDGVTRGGERVAAFVALLDAEAQTIEWACAGHPGADVIGPVAFDLHAFPQGSGAGARRSPTRTTPS